MKKIKGKIIYEIEYELKPENYRDGWTEQQMLDTDIKIASEDTRLFVNTYSKNIKIDLKVVDNNKKLKGLK